MWDMSENLGYVFDDSRYNRLVLLFEPTPATHIDRLAQEKSALFAGDRHFIGSHLSNELPFASYQNTNPLRGTDLKYFLSLSERYKAVRGYAEKFMRDSGIAPAGATTKKNQEDPRGMIANYYYQLTTAIVRRYDKEHLTLGTRLHD